MCAFYRPTEAMASCICLAEAARASRSSADRGISSTSSRPLLPTMEGTLRHSPSRPYWPSSTAEIGSTAFSSRRMHWAMRPTAMAMP